MQIASIGLDIAKNVFQVNFFGGGNIDASPDLLLNRVPTPCRLWRAASPWIAWHVARGSAERRKSCDSRKRFDVTYATIGSVRAAARIFISDMSAWLDRRAFDVCLEHDLQSAAIILGQIGPR